MNARLLDAFAALRPDLPHPLEAPALDDDGAPIECGAGCGLPLAASEYEADGDHDGERRVFCGRDTCRRCHAEAADAS